VLFGDSKAELWDVRRQLQNRLNAMRLKLHSTKTQVRPSAQGLNFLGFKLSRDGRRLQQSTLQRFNRRLRRQKWLFRRGALKPGEISRSLTAWTAHVKHANSLAIRRLLISRMRFTTAQATHRVK
jgi:hypothetical protein